MPAATVLIAVLFAEGRVRFLLLVSVVLAVLGMAAAYLFGDLTPSILIVQLQLWRALWLLKVLSLFALPFCADRLWSEGRAEGRFVLALLIAAWCVIGQLLLAAPLGIAAVAVAAVSHFRGPIQISRPFVWGAIALAAVLAVGPVIGNLLIAAEVIRAIVAHGFPLSPKMLAALGVHNSVIVAAAIVLSVNPPKMSAKLRMIGFAVCIAMAATLATLRWLEDMPHDPTKADLSRRAQLEAMIGAAPNGVVWLSDDVAPWFLIDRPTWVNSLQGTVGAFSRPMAMQWDVRSKQLVASGAGTIKDRNPSADIKLPEKPAAKLSQAIVRLCQVRDGPSVIVAPRDLSPWFGVGQAGVWKPVGGGAIKFKQPLTLTHVEPERLDRFTVVRCAPGLELSGRGA